MRIASSALLGLAVLFSSFVTLAQPEPIPPVPAPVPQPVLPPLPPAAQPADPPAPPGAQPPVQPPPPTPSPPYAPPLPPPPGSQPSVPPPPPIEPVFTNAPAGVSIAEQKPLAGWHGTFFLRDPNDYF